MKTKFVLPAMLLLGAGVVLGQEFMNFPSMDNTVIRLTRDSVQTLDKGYIMLPPEPVLRDVIGLDWNPAGTRLIVATQSQEAEVEAALQNLLNPPPVESTKQFALVDAKTLKFTWINGLETEATEIDFQWSENSEFCVVTSSRYTEEDSKTTYSTLNPRTGKATQIFQSTADQEGFVESFDPNRMILVVQSRQGEDWKVTDVALIGADGLSKTTVPGLKEAFAGDWVFAGWSKKYGTVMFSRPRNYAVLMPNGSLQPIDAATFIADSRAERANIRQDIKVSITTKKASQGNELWLRTEPDMGERSNALVCAMTEEAALSPSLNAVAYTSQRMLWVRPIIQVDVEQYAMLRRQAIKLEAMMQGKHVATALLIYATDYDDIFPTDNFADVLRPYAKDSSIFSRFTFQVPKGSITALADPASTSVGFIDTEVGRATVFADGHVEWKDK